MWPLLFPQLVELRNNNHFGTYLQKGGWEVRRVEQGAILTRGIAYQVIDPNGNLNLEVVDRGMDNWAECVSRIFDHL